MAAVVGLYLSTGLRGPCRQPRRLMARMILGGSADHGTEDNTRP